MSKLTYYLYMFYLMMMMIIIMTMAIMIIILPEAESSSSNLPVKVIGCSNLTTLPPASTRETCSLSDPPVSY